VTDPRQTDMPDVIARGLGDTPPGETASRLWPWAILGGAVLALVVAFLAYLPG
jgi:hypothetical protein